MIWRREYRNERTFVCAVSVDPVLMVSYYSIAILFLALLFAAAGVIKWRKSTKVNEIAIKS